MRLSRARARVKASLTMRVRQVLQSLWASVGIQIFLFASGILVARSLGPGNRGNLAIVLILPVVASQVTCIGTPSAATYFIAKHRTHWRLIARDLIAVSALQTGFALVLLFALNAYFLTGKGDATRTAGFLALISVPLQIAQYYALAILQGLGDLRWFNVYRVASPAAYTIGLGGSLFFGLTVVGCTAIWLASLTLIAAAMLKQLHARAKRARETETEISELPTRREVIRFGVIGFLAQVSPIETFRVDSLLIAAIFPSQVVGYYAVANSLSNVPRFVADGIVAVGYPHVAEQEPDEGRHSTKRYLIAATVLCGGTSLITALALPWLIPVLFGDRFRPATTVSIILVSAAAFISVRRVGSDCLRALGKPGASTVIEIVTWLVLVPTFAIMGHWANGQGVATSLGLSAVIGLGLMLPLVRERRARAAT